MNRQLGLFQKTDFWWSVSVRFGQASESKESWTNCKDYSAHYSGDYNADYSGDYSVDYSGDYKQSFGDISQYGSVLTTVKGSRCYHSDMLPQFRCQHTTVSVLTMLPKSLFNLCYNATTVRRDRCLHSKVCCHHSKKDLV